MTISESKIERTRDIIKALYSAPCSGSSVLSAISSVGKVIGAEYGAVLMLSSADPGDCILVSTNPPGYNEVYRSVIQEDFLLETLLDTGSPYILRRDTGMDVPEHRRFIDTVQSARPVSDVIYVPISKDGVFLGECAVARAGLASPYFSDEDIDLFLFISSFVVDCVLRALDDAGPPEFTAYLDYHGNVALAGLGFAGAGYGGAAVSEQVRRGYNRFLHGSLSPGMDRARFAVGSTPYEARYRLLPAADLRPRAPGFPFASVELTEVVPGTAATEPCPALDRLAACALTARERQVVREMNRGLSNKKIALKLGVDESTVKRHTHNIYEKTGYGSRVELLLGIKAK